MNRLRALLLVLVASLALAGSWRSLMSPGALYKGHSEHDGNCDKCHLAFDGIPNEKCLDCHAPLASKIATGKGFHAKHAGEACIDCHTDHKGLEGHPTKEAAAAAFAHVETGFSLEGAHGKLSCDDCHSAPVGEMDVACSGCHLEDDPHQSALGPACSDCHLTTKWTDGLKRVIDHALLMDGKHGDLGCADCHAAGAHIHDTVSCAECHDQGHGGTDASCSNCHQVTGWQPAEFDHDPCGCTFPGKHQTVECLACHQDFKFTDTPERCSSCHIKDRTHDDIGECSGCHTATSWSENLFDHNKRTQFKLDGMHLEQDCTACHTKKGEFGGLKTDCESCHQQLGDETHGDFGGCLECHGTEGFTPSSFDHGKTRFGPLGGKHGTLKCQACHAEKTEGFPAE